MANRRLYIIHGAGSDAVGLVGNLTQPLAKSGGNILDMRQDILHGLFTISMVVDFSGSSVLIDDLRLMLKTVSEETGLHLWVDNYIPVLRTPPKRNLLIVLVGNDRAGIIAAISTALRNYGINIELSRMVAREGIFLMELSTDISTCSLPFDNLTSVLAKNMESMGIRTMFQTEDVFNKKKRALVFSISSSFIDSATTQEVLTQAGISSDEARSYYTGDHPRDKVALAARALSAMPLDVIDAIASKITATPGTAELLQTLRVMGYKVALVSNAFSLFTGALKEKFGLDYEFGVGVEEDDDTRTLTGELGLGQLGVDDIDRATAELLRAEKLAPGDITVISDTGMDTSPGLRIQFPMETVLDFYNKHIINRENIIGLLGSFGLPRL